MKTTKGKPVSPGQVKALHVCFRKVGFDNDERHAFIYQFTNGRVNSTKDLTFDEALNILSKINEDEKRKTQIEAKEVLKAIFHLSFKIPFLNKGFSNNTEEEFEMNKAKINMFARNKSSCHKNVNAMYLSELKSFKKQLEAIAYSDKRK